MGDSLLAVSEATSENIDKCICMHGYEHENKLKPSIIYVQKKDQNFIGNYHKTSNISRT